MPPRRITSPRTLESLCLSQVLNYLEKECSFCSQVRKYQKGSLLLRRRGIDANSLEKELESYLDTLPPLLNENVRQYIVKEVLNTHARIFLKHPDTYVSLLNIVLNKEVKILEFNDQAHVSYESDIWSVITKKCTGLRRFVLTHKMMGIQTVTPMQPFLKKVVSNCPMLTELILKDVVQGYDTLSTIGKSCPVLKILDIAGALVNCVELAHLFVASTRARNLNVDSLLDGPAIEHLNPLCSTLEVVILADSDVKARGAALAIKVLPNLVTLGKFIYLAAGIKRLYGTKNKPKTALKISQGFYVGPSFSKLKVLANCCPAIQTLHIGAAKMRRITGGCLAYKALRSLTIENIEFDSLLECTMLLEQLVDLQISAAGIDVAVLGKHCPNLEKLCLTGDPLKVPLRPAPGTMFTKLKELKMLCIASSECVGFIIKRAFDIQSIEIVRVRDLNDNVFAKWIEWNPLLLLESLMIRYADLTRTSVDLLLEHCPQLTRLGELGGWDIRSWECRRLKDLVLRENLELHLVLYSRNADSIIIDILTENTSSEEDVGV